MSFGKVICRRKIEKDGWRKKKIYTFEKNRCASHDVWFDGKCHILKTRHRLSAIPAGGVSSTPVCVCAYSFSFFSPLHFLWRGVVYNKRKQPTGIFRLLVRIARSVEGRRGRRKKKRNAVGATTLLTCITRNVRRMPAMAGVCWASLDLLFLFSLSSVLCVSIHFHLNCFLVSLFPDEWNKRNNNINGFFLFI
jgi:hypothetical protein